MAQREYMDLAEFGLTFVLPDDARFAELVRDIEERPQPFGSWPIDDLTNSVVLLNESGKALIALAYVWRYTMADGTSNTHRSSNLGSSSQLEMLSGRAPLVRDLGTCILAGSKRIICERGMFGNNLDVLGDDPTHQRGSYVGAGGGGRGGGGGGSRGTGDHGTSIRLSLDFAVFEDGLVAGPDEFGMFEALTESLAAQRLAAENAAAATRDGASEGVVFEILLPLAKDHPTHLHSGRRRESVMSSMFAHMAIHQLINSSRADQLAWFERMAQPSRLHLHR